MNEKEWIDQLEMVVSGMLQRQDQMNEDIHKLRAEHRKLRTSQWQPMQMSMKTSDNVAFALGGQAEMSEKIGVLSDQISSLISAKNAKDAKLEMIMNALQKHLDRK